MWRKIISLSLAILVSMGFPAFKAHAQDGPFIEANVTADWVVAYDIFGISTVTLNVYESEPPSDVRCSDTWELNGNGEVFLDCWDIGIEPGNYIELLDGEDTVLKELLVLPLTLDVFDPDNDLISGTAPNESTVRVDVCHPPPDEFTDPECASEEVYLETGIDWEVDFSPFDISPEDWYAAFITEDDGDATMAEITPQPSIAGNLTISWITIDAFPAWSSVWVEIYETSQKQTLRFQESLDTDHHGAYGLDFLQGLFPGNVIVATYEEITKELELVDLTLDEFNTEDEEISGAAPHGTVVHVVIEGGAIDYYEMEAISEQGFWLADFSAEGIDLEEDMSVYAYVEDGDGDRTEVLLPSEPPPPEPYIIAWPVFDYVQGMGWREGVTVTLIVDDDENLDNGFLYEATGVSGPSEWDPSETVVGFGLDHMDLQPGHNVILFGDERFKFHSVTDLNVIVADPDTEIVSGTAVPDSDVFLWIHWTPFTDVWTVADGTGNWVGDFTLVYDIELGTGGIAAQFDEDGNGTFIEWYAVTPDWMVEEIERLVDEGKLAPEFTQSLTAKIENTSASIEKGNFTAAVRELRAFINEVEAQVGHKISGDAAFLLINYALNLIAQYEGGN